MYGWLVGYFVLIYALIGTYILISTARRFGLLGGGELTADRVAWWVVIVESYLWLPLIIVLARRGLK